MLRNLGEINRILKSDGHAYIQDRTFQDIIQQGEKFWIRNTLFECFPQLLEYEKKRRPDSEQYEQFINQTGLHIFDTENISEVRKEHSDIGELCSEIMKRKGKSILFELSDEQLLEYCRMLKSKAKEEPIVEQDIWTVWNLRKP